jgi:hypothetical protein
MAKDTHKFLVPPRELDLGENRGISIGIKQVKTLKKPPIVAICGIHNGQVVDGFNKIPYNKETTKFLADVFRDMYKQYKDVKVTATKEISLANVKKLSKEDKAKLIAELLG